MPLDQQQEPCDRVGEANNATVGGDIGFEITGGHRLDKGHSLAKGKREPLAGDRIAGAGGVPDQGEVAVDHPAARLFEGPCTTVLRSYRRILETLPKARKAREEIVEGGGSAGPQERHPDQTLAYRRHVGLTAVGPIDLDQIGPRLEIEVAAHAESPTTCRAAVETRPPADSRGAPVGADQPPPANRAVIGFEAVG